MSTIMKRRVFDVSKSYLVFLQSLNFARQTSSSDTFMIDGRISTSLRQGRSGSYYNDQLRDRGSVSFVTAQAGGVRSLMDGSAGSRDVEFGFSINVLDDASMWVSAPKPEIDGPFDSQFEARMCKAMGPRGKNVHLPVLNFCESIYSLSAPSGAQQRGQTHGAELHSPAQAMPRANTATVYDRWIRWAFSTVGGAGAKAVGDDADVLTTILNIDWRMVVYGTDNLVLNSNIVCLEEEFILRFQRFGGHGENSGTTILPIKCQNHSAVLAMQPTMKRVGSDYPSILGHLFFANVNVQHFSKRRELQIK